MAPYLYFRGAEGAIALPNAPLTASLEDDEGKRLQSPLNLCIML